MRPDEYAGRQDKSISGAVFDVLMAKEEREKRRLWIALIVAIALIFVSNMAWLGYEMQFDTYVYEQDGEGVNNIGTTVLGGIINGPAAASESAEAAD